MPEFVRKGIVGDWQNHFSREQAARLGPPVRSAQPRQRRHRHHADLLAHHGVAKAAERGLAQQRVADHERVQFLRRDLHAAAHDDVLAAADEAIELPAITGDLEQVWPRIRAKYGKGTMPRTLNCITGPSRSGDIEQTILLGAHGPRRLHVLIVES